MKIFIHKKMDVNEGDNMQNDTMVLSTGLICFKILRVQVVEQAGDPGTVLELVSESRWGSFVAEGLAWWHVLVLSDAEHREK